MFVAQHLILSAYGFWLPNDPRGSGSNYVGSDALFDIAGRAMKVEDGRSRAYDAHDRTARLAAKALLKLPPVLFTGVHARAIGRGVATHAEQAAIPMWACAILPDHAHFVIAECGRDPDQVMQQFKAAATRRMLAEGVHPFQGQSPVPKCFAQGGWKVFLKADAVERTIRYVEDNPIKAGLPAQKWWFVSRETSVERGPTKDTPQN